MEKELKVRDKTELLLLESFRRQPYCISETMLRALFWAYEHEGSPFRPRETLGWVSNATPCRADRGLLNALLRLKRLYILDWEVSGNTRSLVITVRFTDAFRTYVLRTRKKWSKNDVCMVAMDWRWALRAFVKLAQEVDLDPDLEMNPNGCFQAEVEVPEGNGTGFRGRFVKKKVDLLDYFQRFVICGSKSFNPMTYRMAWEMDAGFQTVPFPVRNYYSAKMYTDLAKMVRQRCERRINTKVERLQKQLARRFREGRMTESEYASRRELLHRISLFRNQVHLLYNTVVFDDLTEVLAWWLKWDGLSRWYSELKYQLWELGSMVQNVIGYAVFWYALQIGVYINSVADCFMGKTWGAFFATWFLYPKGKFWLRQYTASAGRLD